MREAGFTAFIILTRTPLRRGIRRDISIIFSAVADLTDGYTNTVADDVLTQWTSGAQRVVDHPRSCCTIHQLEHLHFVLVHVFVHNNIVKLLFRQ